jgi:hypothetical protein
MYIHLFQYDHILVCVMKTRSTFASSIFWSMTSMLSNGRSCRWPPSADRLAFFASLLADELRRRHEV